MSIKKGMYSIFKTMNTMQPIKRADMAVNVRRNLLQAVVALGWGEGRGPSREEGRK